MSQASRSFLKKRLRQLEREQTNLRNHYNLLLKRYMFVQSSLKLFF